MSRKNKPHRVTRGRRRAHRQPVVPAGVQAGVALLLTLGGCSWFDTSQQPARVSTASVAQEQPYPNLGTVPNEAPPTTTPAERQAIVQGLTADSSNAQYTDQEFGAAPTGVAPAAPPAPPTLPAPDTTAAAATDDGAAASPVVPSAPAEPAPPAAPVSAESVPPAPVPPPAPSAYTPPESTGSAVAPVASVAPPAPEPAPIAEPAPMAEPVAAPAPPPAPMAQPAVAPEPPPAPQPVAQPVYQPAPQPMAAPPAPTIVAQPMVPPAPAPAAMASGSALGMGSGSALTIGGGATVPVAPAEPSIPANTGPVLRNGSALSMPGPGQQSSSLGSPLVQGQLAAGPMAPPIPGPISSSRSVLVDLTALDAPPAPAAVAPAYATAALAAPAAPPMAAAPLGRPVAVIYFGNASSKLSAHDRKVLRQLAQQQRRHGGQVLVVGHSSTAGDPALNLRLSERRAGAVAAALRGFGIPAAGIATDALGAEQPLYQETSATGEAGNRRVEIYLGS